MRPFRVTAANIGVVIGASILWLAGPPVLAQVPITDTPDTIGQRGFSTTGQIAPSQIESVNPVNGNVTLRIPLGHLPPGPAGLSAGVDLVYNSSVADVKPQNPSGGSPYTFLYKPSAKGGGWDYTYKYTLWAQPRYPSDQISVPSVCSTFPAGEVTAWFKNFLMTPDGASHVLTLSGVLDSNGNQVQAPWASGPNWATDQNNDAYMAYDFAGLPNPFCSLPPGYPSPSFYGTLVLETNDSTFIRVEANTYPCGSTVPGACTWTAYLPDGSQVSGPINTGLNSLPQSGAATASDSEASQIKDRNGNTVTISGACSPGRPCMRTITDALLRPVQITYAATASGGWTDTVESLGVHSSLDSNNNIVNPLTANVNWETYTPTQSVPYPCEVDGNGNTVDNTSPTCDLANDKDGTAFSTNVVTSVQLPPPAAGGNSTTFNFTYNTTIGGNHSWGELHSMTKCAATATVCPTPQSAPPNDPNVWSVSYDYLFDWPYSSAAACAIVNYRPVAYPGNPICQRVLSYQELRDAVPSTVRSETTLYNVSVPVSMFTPPFFGNATHITNPDGSQASIYSASGCQSGPTSRDFCPPFVSEIDNPDSSVTRFGWASNLQAGVSPYVVVNPYVRFRTDAPSSGAVQKGAETQRDPNGNLIKTVDYDWGVTAGTPTGSANITSLAGSQLRTTTISYYNTTTYDLHSAPPFLRAPNTVTVCAATGCTGGSTTYIFDSPTTTANLKTLQQTDSVQGTISTYRTYLANGNLSTTIDPNGVETIICYDSNSLYRVSSVVAVQTNASCPSPPALPEGRGTAYSIDGTTGRVDSVKDSDNQITTSYGYDDTGRVTSSTQTGGALSRVTSTAFDDVNLSVTTTQDDTSTQKLVTTTAYDALGRVRLTVDGAGDKVQRAYQYGAGGSSYELASNPYAAASDSTMGWTLITKDAVGRSTSVQYFKGDGTLTNAPAPWNATGGGTLTPTGTESMVYSDFSANCPSGTANPNPANKVIDAAGILHTYWLDGLGRLTAVTEADGTISNYAYDALDNLSAVSAQSSSSSGCPTAGNVLRSFVYSNPLSRLQSASNLEGASATYNYDNNGNVTQRTDATGTVTTAVANPATGKPYDGLNRPYGYSYAPAAGNPYNVAATPLVTYGYDQGGFKGALSSVSATLGTLTYSTSYTYDTLGRISGSTQNVPGYAPLTFSYGYSLTDQLTSMTYPTLGTGTGRQVKYTLDAADRVQTVQNVTGGGNYASIGYTPANGVQTVTMGNGVAEQISWNDRLQAVGLSAASAQGSLLMLGLYPCPQNQTQNQTSCPSVNNMGNNGNLLFQTISFPAIGNVPGLNLTQSYTYDPVGRLSTAAEGSGSWSQSYGYTNGNRYVNPGSSSISAFTPTSASNFDANNRLQVNGAKYDNNVANGNGNQTAIGGYMYSYDAENRMVSAALSAGATLLSSAGYVYDGLGQRVQKATCGSSNPCMASSGDATITTYVYDAFGNLAQEYGSPVTFVCGTPTCYLTTDHLGSTRLVTDANGLVGSRYDYLPFGEDVPAGTGGRTGSMGYGVADIINPRYAGQMEDPESARYSMGFRYYSPAEGRFVSVDPANAGADASDPQTWNGYSYVSNNPLTYTDPSGEGLFGAIFGILGGLFGGPWGALAGSAVGNGMDAAIWGPGAAGIPGTPFNLGSLTSCGGPLGNCGSLGAGPWSEITDLGNVRDPGRFIFSAEEQQKNSTGFWTIDYKGDPYWYEPEGPGVFSTGAQLKVAPKQSKFSVAGGCVVSSLKDHLLGIGAATAGGYLPKRLLGVREVGSSNTTLLSKLGSYINIQTTRVYGPGARSTTNLFRGLGRVLGPAAMVINAGELLKAGQDASSCYSISH